MSKPKKIDINELVMKTHKGGVKQAIELAARTNTSLVIYENGRLKSVKPNFKYVRAPIKPVVKRSKAPSSKRKNEDLLFLNFRKPAKNYCKSKTWGKHCALSICRSRV